MIDLAIGTRFYYKGKLCEVVEAQSDKCKKCIIGCYSFIAIACHAGVRQDRKDVSFRLVQEIEEENNG